MMSKLFYLLDLILFLSNYTKDKCQKCKPLKNIYMSFSMTNKNLSNDSTQAPSEMSSINVFVRLE